MATVSVPIKIKASPRPIRPVDPAHDLPAVVDLIAIGFQDELGPEGQKMLKQMQRLAHPLLPLPLLTLFSSPDSTLPGFVWEEGECIVANLSLRRATASRGQGWIIGNVVVHPDFRGRGIGRALMETALDTVRVQDGRWIGLEVRATNEVARHLYKSLHFYDVGRTVHMLRSTGDPWPDFPAPSGPWRPTRPADRHLWAQLAASIYDILQRRILEIYPARYAFGALERRLSLWFQGEREDAWLEPTPSPRRAVRVRTDRRHRFHRWDLLVHPRQPERTAEETVAQARAATLRHHRDWPVTVTVEAGSPTLPFLETLGFRHHRTLVQMYQEMN
ncbi:MAG: GNAT family N-acetyltransferase [Anaerolineae bacterium]